MFRFEIEATYLKTFINTLKEFTEYVNLQITKQGIYVNTLDSSNVCLLDMHILKEDMISYQVDNETTLGVSVVLFDKVLKSAKKQVTITNNNLALHIEYEAKSGHLEYDLPGQDIPSEPIVIPPSEYSTELSIDPSILANICTELKVIGENAKINVHQDGKVQFTSSDDLAGLATVTALDKANKYNKNNKVSVVFTLSYLTKICKLSKICSNLQIKLSEKESVPIKFDFSTNTGSTYKFTLATVVTDDENDNIDEDVVNVDSVAVM